MTRLVSLIVQACRDYGRGPVRNCRLAQPSPTMALPIARTAKAMDIPRPAPVAANCVEPQAKNADNARKGPRTRTARTMVGMSPLPRCENLSILASIPPEAPRIAHTSPLAHQGINFDIGMVGSWHGRPGRHRDRYRKPRIPQ